MTGHVLNTVTRSVIICKLDSAYILAKSTDRDKLTANKLTANQRFCYSDFVTDFAAVISSQSEGLGMMALGIVKIYLGSPFSPISIVRGQFVHGKFVRGQLVRGQFVAVSCRGPAYITYAVS